MKILFILTFLLFTIITSCKKDETVPVVTTTSISGISGTEAVCGGTVISDGGKTVTSRGVCWNTSINPTISDNKTMDGAGTGSFTSNLTGLVPGTNYFVRAYATNSVGTAYGADSTFLTLGQVPSVSTLSAIGITTTGSNLFGKVNANNLSTSVTFEYGTTTSYGNTVTASQSPITGDTLMEVSASISGLTAGTTYHYRVKAVNSLGSAYGNDLSFTTTYPVNDIDDNAYNTVQIGTQLWMAENLKTTRYNDGTAIPIVTDNTAWAALTTGSYCNYNNTPSISTTYGRLYNWYAVDNNIATKLASNGGKNVCPSGWHIPAVEEFITLTTCLGGESVAGGKMKETGTTHWTTPNTDATNSSGFSGLPGGFRYKDGSYNAIGRYTYWWSSTENGTINAWIRDLTYIDSIVIRDYADKRCGFSVRCIKD